MNCKICSKSYEKPMQSVDGRIQWPVCGLLCLALYKKWKLDKNQQRQATLAKANHRRMMRAMAKAYQRELPL